MGHTRARTDRVWFRCALTRCAWRRAASAADRAACAWMHAAARVYARHRRQIGIVPPLPSSPSASSLQVRLVRSASLPLVSVLLAVLLLPPPLSLPPPIPHRPHGGYA